MPQPGVAAAPGVGVAVGRPGIVKVGVGVFVIVGVGVSVGVGLIVCVGVGVTTPGTTNLPVPGKVKRPRPGRPATEFTASAVVGGMQNSEPSFGCETLSTGGSGWPCVSTEAPTAPLSVKHSRKRPFVHVSPGFVQSELLAQPRNVSIAQNCSNGPAAHVPSFTESLAGGVLGEHVASLQSFGCVVWPTRVQAPPPGHSELLLHGAPLFVPLLQRLPPQMPGLPPLSGQSALVAHALALALLHVSQKHLSDVKPGDVHVGFAADKVRLVNPVERFSVMFKLPTSAPGSGGQS